MFFDTEAKIVFLQSYLKNKFVAVYDYACQNHCNDFQL